MTDVKISQLPAATRVEDNDLVVIVQGCVTKRATAAMLRGGSCGCPSDDAAPPTTPSNVSPSSDAVNVSTGPILEGSAYSHPNGVGQAAMQAQVAAGGDFSNILYDSGVISGAVARHQLPVSALPSGTLVRWRLRYQDAEGRWSAWSLATAFVTSSAGTVENRPTTPAAIFPTDSSANVPQPLTLRSSPYSHPDGVPQAGSRWRLYDPSGTLVYDSGVVADADTHAVPTNTLELSQDYTWTVEHFDGTLWSASSEAAAFTTAAARAVPNIGEAWEGGFYAGQIMDNGVPYAVVVAPKAQGEHPGISWQVTENTAAPVACITLTDGPGAHAAMIVANNNAGRVLFPAADWADSLVINEYSDWFVPPRDALELIWRNLKPVAISNSVIRKGSSERRYNRGGNIEDLPGDYNGINRHSIPNTGPFTESVPGQTAVAAFQSGGAEAMEFGDGVFYWTCTEYGDSRAGMVWFYASFPGSQSYMHKVDPRGMVRAVRYVPLS